MAEAHKVSLWGISSNNYIWFLDSLFDEVGNIRRSHFSDLASDYARAFGGVGSNEFDEKVGECIDEAVIRVYEHMTENFSPTQTEWFKERSLDELESMPTLEDSGFENIKVKEDDVSVRLSRAKIADGAPYDNQVVVHFWITRKVKERAIADWVTVKQYQAK